MARLDAIASTPGTADADTQLDETVEQWRALTEAPDLAARWTGMPQFNAKARRGPRGDRGAAARRGGAAWPRPSARRRGARHSSPSASAWKPCAEKTRPTSSNGRGRSGKACLAPPPRSARTPSSGHASTSPAGARPSATRIARRSNACTRGSASCRSKPIGCHARRQRGRRRGARGSRAEVARGRGRVAVPRRPGRRSRRNDRGQVCRGRHPRPPARRREARGRRAHAEAAGAAGRTVARARHGAGGGRRSERCARPIVRSAI